MAQYQSFLPTYKDGFEIIIFLCITSVVQSEYLRLNVTRQSTGDILAFGYKVDCASLNAQCLPKDKREIGRNICESCKCLSRYTSYVSTEKQCININGITDLNCRTLHKQMPVMNKSTNAIGGPIEARHCRSKTKARYPQLHSGNAERTTWSWDRMTDVEFSVTSTMKLMKANSRIKVWQVTFKNTTISKMLTKYSGRIVKLKIRCSTGDVCIIFKIAGSFVGNSTVAKHPYDPYSPDSSHPTTIGTTILSDYSTESSVTLKTSGRPSGNDTVENQNLKSEKNNQTIWIIVTAILIVIVIIAVLAFICYKRNKTTQSDAEYPRRDIVPHEYDVPIILNSTNNEGHGRNENKEHIYETFSETPYVNSPECSRYQELNHNDRDRDPSHLYQPLIKPVQSVHPMLDDQTRYTKPIANDDKYESMSSLSKSTQLIENKNHSMEG